tara:strand:+ start:7859 stop:10681 length:2823 start_codon:yes stop_codon:yes gene_type:complete
MAISPLMFESSQQIPFANLQQATLSYNAENEAVVKLQISNELAKLPSPEQNIGFGNFVFLSTEKGTLDAMLYDDTGHPDMSRLKTLIKGTKLSTSQVRNKEFLLTAQDFHFKTLMSSHDTERKIHQYVYSEESVLRDTKGGSATTGLLVAAHTQDDEILGLDSREVSSLYVLVASYRIVGEMCFIGNVSRETLLENNVSAATSHLYRLTTTMEGYGQQGDVWPGPIHTHHNLIMAGDYHTDEEHPALTPSVVENLKIQDLRFLSSARQLSFENVPAPYEDKPYFSPVTLSRNPSGEILGMFAFDLRSYVVQNARFGGLMKNPQALLSSVQLDDIKLYRRVASGGANSNALTPGTDMNLSEVTPAPFEYFASFKKGDVQLIQVPNLENEDILNIVFSDKAAAQLDMGVAEYRAEVLIADNTAEVLGNLRDMLQAGLRDYTAHLTGRGNGDKILEQLIDAYLATVNFIFGSLPFAEFSMLSWKKNLVALGAAANTNQADHLLVSNIVETFAAQISNVLKVGQATTSLSSKNYSTIYHPVQPGVLSGVHTFRQRYTLKNRKQVGFDYVGDYFSPSSGLLPTVSYEAMSERVSQEVTKYAVPNPNAASINTYGYMSPIQIRTGRKDHPISTMSVQVDTEALTGLLRDRVSPTIELAMEEQKSATTDIQESLAMAGIAVEPLEESLRELLFPDAQKLSEGVSSANYLSRTSRFVDDDTYVRARVSGSFDSILRKSTARSRRIFAAPLARAVFNKQMVQFQPVVKMTNRTILPGALAVAADNAAPTIEAKIDDVSKVINFDSLVRVEYLKSYDQRLGVLAPEWAALNEEIFKTALDAGRPLLCRLNRIEQTITANNILDLESLGTLFSLGPAQNATGRSTYTSVLKNIYDYVRNVDASANKEMRGHVEIYYASNIPLVPHSPSPPSLSRTSAGGRMSLEDSILTGY